MMFELVFWCCSPCNSNVPWQINSPISDNIGIPFGQSAVAASRIDSHHLHHLISQLPSPKGHVGTPEQTFGERVPHMCRHVQSLTQRDHNKLYPVGTVIPPVVFQNRAKCMKSLLTSGNVPWRNDRRSETIQNLGAGGRSDATHEMY